MYDSFIRIQIILCRVSFEELQNVNLKDVWVDPEQRTIMIERLRREGSALNYEVHLRCKDREYQWRKPIMSFLIEAAFSGTNLLF